MLTYVSIWLTRKSGAKTMTTGGSRMSLTTQRHYPYTKKGKEEAKAAAKKMGAKVKYGKKKG